jgi:hypothetical protein
MGHQIATIESLETLEIQGSRLFLKIPYSSVQFPKYPKSAVLGG